jgi:hypothetical protein
LKVYARHPLKLDTQQPGTPKRPPPQDSYAKDFGLGQFRKAADFEPDDMVLAKVGKKTVVMA